MSIILLFLLPLVPLYYDEIPLPKLHLYEKFNNYISKPFSSMVALSRQGTKHLWSRYISLLDVEAENQNLKNRLSLLEKDLNDKQEIEKENERLKQLLQIKPQAQSESIAARVIGYDPLGERLSFFINAGSDKGLRENMPVIVPEGIVGTIQAVYPTSALITSLLNPNHSVDGRILRSRSRMIVEGLGEPLLAKLKYLDRAEDVRVGDEVITSDLDPVFPKGLRIGTIVEIKRPKTGVTQNANIRAAVDLGKLEEVIVIKKAVAKLDKGEP